MNLQSKIPKEDPQVRATYQKLESIQYAILDLLKKEELNLYQIKSILRELKWKIKHDTIYK